MAPFGTANAGPVQRRTGAAVLEGKLVRNVARLAKPPEHTPRERETWSKAEVRKFLAKASSDRLHVAWRLSLYGLRRGEVLGLRWSELMELAHGRVIFESYGAYAAGPAAIAAMLDQAVADMQDRASRFAGRQRDHTPTVEDPFTVLLVDEVAFLTAYQPDRNLKTRIMSALSTLTTQGRAVGYAVVGDDPNGGDQ